MIGVGIGLTDHRPIVRSPYDKVLADNSLAFWNTTDTTSMFAGLNGANGDVADQSTVGIWASRAGHGSKTFAQIMAGQPELYDQTALETANIANIGTTVSQSDGGLTAINNNSYTGRWTDRGQPLIEPGKWYQATYTIAELLNGETRTRLQAADKSLNNNPSSGRPSSGGPLNTGTGTFTCLTPPRDSTDNRYVGVFNGTAGGDFGHRCSSLSIKEIPTSVFYAPANNNLALYEASEQGLWFNGVEAMLRHDFAGGAGPADVDAWVVMKTTDDQFIVFLNGDAGIPYAVIAKSGDTSPTISRNYGDPAILIGGSGIGSRGALHSALADGSTHIVEVQSADMSGTSSVRLSGYGAGWNMSGHVQSMTLSDPSARLIIQSALAAKYGITLP